MVERYSKISGVYRGTVALRRSERAAKTRGVRNGRCRLSLTRCVTCVVSTVVWSVEVDHAGHPIIRQCACGMAVVARPVAIGSIPLSDFERSATRRAVGFGTRSGARVSPAAQKLRAFRARGREPRISRSAMRRAPTGPSGRGQRITRPFLLSCFRARACRLHCALFSIQTTQENLETFLVSHWSR